MFGNKSCFFPASSAISAFLQSKSNYKSPFGLARPGAERKVLSHPNVPNRKVYDASIYMADQYREAMASSAQAAMKLSHFLELWQVDEVIRFQNGTFRITSSTGAKIESRNVVIATGRGGYGSIRQWLDQLGVGFVEQSPDIGIRLEASTEAFSDRFLYQTDPKFKFDFGKLGTARTFCTCKGGSIVPVKFGRGVFADGAFLRKDTGRTNTAIMVRTGETHTAAQLETWCEAASSRTDGSLFLGSVTGQNRPGYDLVKEIMKVVPDGPSKQYGELLRATLKELTTNKACKIFKADRQNVDTIKVYGPAIDLYWPKVEIQRGFKTAVEGVYVIGDATGISRGIHQAAMSGRGLAQLLIEERLQGAAGW